MASPSVSATQTTSVSALSGTWTVNLPATTTADAGKLFFMFIRVATASRTLTLPSGWTQIGSMNNEASQQEYIWWKRVAGTEGSTVSITTIGGTAKGAVAVLLISGNADPNSKSPDNTASTSFTGTANTHPDPGSVSMSPTCDALYLAFGSWTSNATVTTYPSGYTGNGYVSSGGTSTSADCAIAVPYKQATGSASDDPGQYTISASRTWTCRTVGVFPGNYLAVSSPITVTSTIAMITSKLASITAAITVTRTVNAQKQWFAQISKALGPTISATGIVSKLAAITANFGPTITAQANWAVNLLMGPVISAAGVVTRFGVVTKNYGPVQTVNALGGGFMNIVLALGGGATVSAGRVANVAVSQVLGLYNHICAWVNPKFLRSFTEDTLTLTAEAEDTLTATAEAEDPFSVVVLAEVTMNLTAEPEDTLTLTTETEESTEC